ncbi:sensor histidine kinase [Paenibacillus sepulcri]|uniref:Histidine kinase n=1 Tax=Paenibacillus sepulcri TaxID=359917 RepID=A0ABS7BVU4_9BACL|nr:histidine kinase [Paenibacillus sepulcri]
MNTAYKVKFFYVVFAFTIAIVLVSSVTISLIIYYRFNSAIAKQNDDFIQNTSAQLKSNVLTLVDNCETIAGNIYADTALQTFLEGYHNQKIDYDMFEKFNSITDNLQSILSNNTEISSISIYKRDAGLVSNGKEIRIWGQFGRVDLLQKAMDAGGKDVWASYRDEASGAYKIVLMKYLNVYAPGGVLVIELNEESFYDLYKSGMASNYLFLMDNQNQVISSNSRGSIGKEINAPVKRFVSEGEATGKLVYDNTRYYLFSEQVNDSWSLAVLYDSNEIEKEKRNITYYIIFYTAILILVSMLLAFLFSKRFAGQVDKLVAKIKEIDKGNLNIQPTISQVNEFYLLDQALYTMARNINSLNSDILNVQKQKEESEIKYLQMQMNPHFLYNLLSAIRWIAFREKQQQIMHIIDHLSDFYKIALSKGNEIIGIQDEIKLVRSYVELQNLSYSGLIRLTIRMDESLNDLQVCKMTLQPFVENSIVHGIVREQPLNISVEIIPFDETGVRIRIMDDGSGIEEDFVRLIEDMNGLNTMTSSASYGITNTIVRLKYLYGDQIRIRAARRTPGTLIEITIKNAS